MTNKRRHNRLRYGDSPRRLLGGWVAPLQPAQFAGSPQADTGDAGDTGSGDAGGDGGTV